MSGLTCFMIPVRYRHCTILDSVIGPIQPSGTKTKMHGPLLLLLPLGTYGAYRMVLRLPYPYRLSQESLDIQRGGERGDFRDIWPFLHVAFTSPLCSCASCLGRVLAPILRRQITKQAGNRPLNSLRRGVLFFYISTDYLTRPLHIYIFTFLLLFYFIHSALFNFFFFCSHFALPWVYYGAIGESDWRSRIHGYDKDSCLPDYAAGFLLLHQYMIR